MASKAPPDLLNASATGSIHMIVRQLFSRMVFSLHMGCSLSMEIIAFWLWLEGNGHPNFLASVESFDNYNLRGIAFAGKMFIEALHRKCHLNPRSEQEGYFQKEAMEGIGFYLNNFCYKALEDILEIAEAKERIYHTNHQQVLQQNTKGKAPMMSTKDLLSKIRAYFTGTPSHEEGSSSRSMPSPKNQILRDIENPIDQCLSTYPLATLFDNLNLRDDPEAVPIRVQQQPSIPRDERTLFVTFSNGYPFTADELFEFFEGNFGDVEVVSVEEPVEPRPPLYAHICFFTQETILHILRGNPRVKFVIRGKHLWARQFVPKRKKVRN